MSKMNILINRWAEIMSHTLMRYSVQQNKKFLASLSEQSDKPEAERRSQQYRMCADGNVFSWSLRITIVAPFLATELRKCRHEVFVQEKSEGQKMSFHGCEHLNSFKAVNGTRSFHIIYSYFIACSSAEARRVKVRKRYHEYSNKKVKIKDNVVSSNTAFNLGIQYLHNTYVCAFIVTFNWDITSDACVKNSLPPALQLVQNIIQ